MGSSVGYRNPGGIADMTTPRAALTTEVLLKRLAASTDALLLLQETVADLLHLGDQIDAGLSRMASGDARHDLAQHRGGKTRREEILDELDLLDHLRPVVPVAITETLASNQPLLLVVPQGPGAGPGRVAELPDAHQRSTFPIVRLA